jgi:hypothetical protein
VDDLWERLDALMGATLYTGSSRHAFMVVTIREDALTVRAATGAYVVIPRADLERAGRLGLAGRSLSHRALTEAGFDPRQVGYLVGLLRALSHLPPREG